jgi:hypothetical protein
MISIKMKHYFWIFAAMLLMVACSSDDDSQDPTLLCKTWLLVSYGNESNEVLKEANGYYHIMTFNLDGTYSVDTDLNKGGGRYTCNGNRITISSPKVTQIYWEGSDPDHFFLGHIDDVYSYVVTNTELRLYYSDNEYFKFRVKK